MRFRVVVRELEAWLLADAERFVTFFAVKSSAIPANPDEVPDAKAALLQVVATSKKAAIREDMLPRPCSGRRVDAAYTSRLIEFVSNTNEGWRPDAAAVHSPSLASCLTRLEELIHIAPDERVDIRSSAANVATMRGIAFQSVPLTLRRSFWTT